jgi:hypothetical protein
MTTRSSQAELTKLKDASILACTSIRWMVGKERVNRKENEGQRRLMWISIKDTRDTASAMFIGSRIFKDPESGRVHVRATNMLEPEPLRRCIRPIRRFIGVAEGRREEYVTSTN